MYIEDDLKFVMFCCPERNKFDRRNRKTYMYICVCAKYEYGRRESIEGKVRECEVAAAAAAAAGRPTGAVK